MKILHTSDWHLGQKLLFNDRTEEYRAALDWLLTTIREQKVDVVLVAGDIFDIGNPPNYARQLYYNFLRALLVSPCRHIVITGGNHDSPAMLNAPRELLEALNIHIVGAATEDIQDELLVLKDAEGEPELIVAAVPFLRDRDLRTSIAGEDEADRQERLQQGLSRHYEDLAVLAENYQDHDIPIMAMGHLYAKGAVASDKQDNIYVGNRENMEAAQFPDIFDYVALGHIHRAQLVEGKEHIRYSGSLIPLSFSETADEKGVYLLSFEGRKRIALEQLMVPTFRRLKTIQGTLEKVQESLDRFAAKTDRLLDPWVEIIVESKEFIPQLDQQIRAYAAEMPLEIVKVRIIRQHQPLITVDPVLPDLDDLDIEEVFRRKCESEGKLSETEMASLLLTFRELQNWMSEQTE